MLRNCVRRSGKNAGCPLRSRGVGRHDKWRRDERGTCPTNRRIAMRYTVIIGIALVAGLTALGQAKEPVVQGEVSYLTGGTGSDERAALDAKSGQFNLKLIHAAPNGDYV